MSWDVLGYPTSKDIPAPRLFRQTVRPVKPEHPARVGLPRLPARFCEYPRGCVTATEHCSTHLNSHLKEQRQLPHIS